MEFVKILRHGELNKTSNINIYTKLYGKLSHHQKHEQISYNLISRKMMPKS